MPRSASPLLVPGLLALAITCGWTADEDYRANAGDNQRPMLGVEMTPVPTSIQDREGIDAHTGVLVQSTYSGTAAESMGLQPNDVILGINGTPITSMSDLRNEIGLTMVGDPVQVQVSRNGQILALGSEIKPWPAQIPYEKLDPAAEKRFRDWQDRRQQRLGDDVDKLAKETERTRKKLTGEEPDDESPGPRSDDPNSPNYQPAFRFHYRIDPALLPLAEAPELDPQTLPELPFTDQPWRVSVALGNSITTL